MARKQAKKAVSQADIERAIRSFKERGGLIQRLPDEVVAPRLMVGSKFGMYESVVEVTASSTSAADGGAPA
jgi:predicted nucleic acid-binding protein